MAAIRSIRPSISPVSASPVDYITALGDDSWSDELIAAWDAEGVGTGRVLRLPGRLPGLYIIQTDAKGERRFSYWRETAAARLLFQAPEGREHRRGARRPMI